MGCKFWIYKKLFHLQKLQLLKLLFLTKILKNNKIKNDCNKD